MVNASKFNIERHTKNGVECLYLQGYLDAHTAPELENTISDVIKTGQNKILVNFNKLDYISSAGLGVFMAFIEELRNTGGDIKLAEMTPKVFSVFDLLGFFMLFDFVQEEKLALEKFTTIKIENE